MGLICERFELSLIEDCQSQMDRLPESHWQRRKARQWPIPGRAGGILKYVLSILFDCPVTELDSADQLPVPELTLGSIDSAF